MDKITSVSQVMTKELVLLNPSDSLQKAISLFANRNVRHLPVVNDHNILGMLSKTDIVRICFGYPEFANDSLSPSLLSSLNVEDVMKLAPICISENEDILTASKKLSEAAYHAFPVVNSLNKLVGIITTTDVINFLLLNKVSAQNHIRR